MFLNLDRPYNPSNSFTMGRASLIKILEKNNDTSVLINFGKSLKTIFERAKYFNIKISQKSLLCKSSKELSYSGQVAELCFKEQQRQIAPYNNLVRLLEYLREPLPGHSPS